MADTDPAEFTIGGARRIVGAVRAVESFGGRRGQVPPQIADPGDSDFWAILGDNVFVSNVYRYGWQQAYYTGGAFTALPGGASGTTTSNYAVNRSALLGTDAYLPSGTVVRMRLDYDVAGGSQPFPPIFSFSLPTGATVGTFVVNPSGLSEDEATWNRTADGTPLSITIQTRTYWDTSGGVLYSYSRTFKFDSLGALISVSVESRHDVDDATDCVT